MIIKGENVTKIDGEKNNASIFIFGINVDSSFNKHFVFHSHLMFGVKQKSGIQTLVRMEKSA